MLNLSATTVLVAGLIMVTVLLIAAIAYQVANRLDRLHVRTDLSRQALEAALARRSAVARAVAASIPDDGGDALRLAAVRAENGDPDDREALENQLSAAIGAIDLEVLPRTLVAEVADSDTRVTMARRFHNDAVRDTRALRGAGSCGGCISGAPPRCPAMWTSSTAAECCRWRCSPRTATVACQPA